MSAKTLYNVWQTAMNDQGIGVEEWDDLDAADRVAWAAVAEYASGH